MRVAGIPVSARLAERLGLPVRSGICVTRDLADSLAGRAWIMPAGPGLRELPVGGDLIIAVYSVRVTGLAGSFAELDRHDHGGKITLSIVRKRVKQELPASLGAWSAG